MLWLGSSLVDYVDPGEADALLPKIRHLREKLADKLSIPLPPVRVQDNPKLPPCGYVFKSHGRDVGHGLVYPNHYRLAVRFADRISPQEKILEFDPVVGRDIVWIRADALDEFLVSRVLSPSESIVLHLAVLFLKNRNFHQS